MATVNFYGSITPTLGVNHIVGTITVPGVYIFRVDTSVLTLGDEIELRTNVQLTSGTIANDQYSSYGNRQSSGLKSSNPVIIETMGHFQIRQVSGTPRLFPFSVISV